MGTKVELHQFIDHAVDIHESKSTVNYVYLNRVLHELVKHLGISNLQISLEGGDTFPPPKQTLSVPTVLSDTGSLDKDREGDGGAGDDTTGDEINRNLSSETAVPTSESRASVLSEKDSKMISDLQEKVSEMEKKMSFVEDLVPDEKKIAHTESMIGDMWNFTNLGKRVDGCEDTLAEHAKLLDGMRKEIKDLNSYKFYLDMLKDNSPNDLRSMINGIVSDMGEKTKQIKQLQDKITKLEGSKPDEALAQELAKKVEGLMKLKEEIESKINTLPTKSDIENIQENYVSWIGLDEILRNYKPPRTPVPPSREGIAALQKADELDQKTDDLGNKLTGLQQEVIKKMDADIVDAKIEEAFKQKRPPSSRTELARQHFAETLQDLQDRLNKLEEEFGGKALPDDLKAQLAKLMAGMEEALKSAELIGAISQENETNKAAIAEINGQMEDLLDRYKILQDQLENAGTGTAEVDPAALQALRDSIQSMKDEQQEHHNELNRLSDDANQKDLHLKTLYSGVDDLREGKADKDFVALEMEDKADKRSVDHKANRVFVDNHFDKLNSGLEAALKRCEGQEQALKNAINQISQDVDGKLDRMELQNVKDFLESRLSKLKGGPPPPPPATEDPDAAGMRRRLLKFHCISCDRPVEVNAGGMIPSSLPVTYGFPGMRSNRPYTTYELELIRQHQRNQNIPRYPWSDPYDMPPTSRSCGGQHTMTYSHRRTRISALSQFFKEDEVVPMPIPLRETEIQGQDGHIYRGRMDKRFPVLPRVGASEKLPRIISPRRKSVL